MPSEKANEFADYWCSDYMNEARMAEDFDDYVAAAVAEEREALAGILNHWARGEVERLLWTHRENVERLTMENRRLRKDAARLQGIRDTLAQDKDDDLVRVEVAYFLDCNMSEIDDAG